jgi:hypothetical protein
MENIQYLLHHQINKIKWDDCINRSVNRLIYAKSFYLDAMAANWDAVVLNDYETVMPLTWKRKWGIAYLYQPAFIQQGGIFYTTELSATTIKLITDKAFEKFKFVEITFNYLNNSIDFKDAALSMRTNYVLTLSKNYGQISAGYHSSITKDLKRCRQFNLQYHFSEDFLNIINLYQELYQIRLPYFSKSDFINFLIICKKMQEENNLIIRKVIDLNGELLAAVILLKDNNRLFNIISCLTDNGKYKGANHFLYDKVIEEFCNSDYTLDFEGSDVKGIADFYRRFQSINQPYPFCKINRLNPFIKLFKL